MSNQPTVWANPAGTWVWSNPATGCDERVQIRWDGSEGLGRWVMFSDENEEIARWRAYEDPGIGQLCRLYRRSSRRDSAPSPEIDPFLEDLIEVMRRHGMSIGHEDTEGGFTLHEFDEDKIQWLSALSDEREDPA